MSPPAGDPFDLGRFVDAQESGGAYARAVAELRRASKTSHWMWFVFPQIAGLGYSAMSRKYAIRSTEEARCYLAHDVLGPRLRACSEIVDATTGRSAEQIFGGIDAQKLHSSMTLFHRGAPEEPVFGRVLEHYFDGTPDAATDGLL